MKTLFLAAVIITTVAIGGLLAASRVHVSPLAVWFSSSSLNEAASAANNVTTGSSVGTFSNTLDSPQVSEHQDGDLIVVMAAQGDLPGSLTVKLHQAADGAVVAGEWAFNVNYTDEIHVPNPEPGQEDHIDMLVQRGTLKGVVTSGQVVSADGVPFGIDALQLSINGGSLEFGSIQAGTANASVTNLNGAGSGTLTLSF